MAGNIASQRMAKKLSDSADRVLSGLSVPNTPVMTPGIASQRLYAMTNDDAKARMATASPIPLKA